MKRVVRNVIRQSVNLTRAIATNPATNPANSSARPTRGSRKSSAQNDDHSHESHQTGMNTTNAAVTARASHLVRNDWSVRNIHRAANQTVIPKNAAIAAPSISSPCIPTILDPKPPRAPKPPASVIRGAFPQMTSNRNPSRIVVAPGTGLTNRRADQLSHPPRSGVPCGILRGGE
jgi:hypothetical protein